MNQEVQKKRGMSKGCLIALIVVGVLVLLLVIAGITCYLKKDELAKYGAVTLVNSIKAELNNTPVEGVDTVKVNAVADAFVNELNEKELDYDKYKRLIQTVQGIMSDKKVDSAEAEEFVRAMTEYFPELEELAPARHIEDSTTVDDSILVE